MDLGQYHGRVAQVRVLMYDRGQNNADDGGPGSRVLHQDLGPALAIEVVEWVGGASPFKVVKMMV